MSRLTVAKAHVSWELQEIWVFAYSLLSFKVYSNELDRFPTNINLFFQEFVCTLHDTKFC